jgi:glycine/D-amino acid oxidase-like deaminating enzyme
VRASNSPRWDDHPDLSLPSLTGEHEAEVCVVGLGGTGLSCITEALALGARSVIGVDAVGIAAGAAGRNGGLLLSGSAEYHHDAVARFGRDRAVAMTQLTLAEIDRIRAEVPDAVRVTGSLRIASDAAELDDCERQRAQMTADGFACESYVGPEGYGIVMHSDAVFHPLRRARIIAQRALQAGARLFGGSRVHAIESSDGPRVRTDAGVVRAKHLIVCVDGHLDQLVPAVASEVRTARLQMLATAPESTVRFTRPVSTRDGFDYWQQLPDGCITLGGGRDITPDTEWTHDATPTPVIQQYLEQTLRQKLGVHAPITHRWAASVGYTDTGLPVFRSLGDGVQVIGGYSGTGNVVGALLGRASAQLALTGRSAIAEVFRPA